MSKEKVSFEQALERLEQIVSQIEEGKVPLEESIEKYAEGVKLVEQCRTILNKAEEKIQLLSRKQGEDQTLVPGGELPEENDQ